MRDLILEFKIFNNQPVKYTLKGILPKNTMSEVIGDPNKKLEFRFTKTNEQLPDYEIARFPTFYTGGAIRTAYILRELLNHTKQDIEEYLTIDLLGSGVLTVDADPGLNVTSFNEALTFIDRFRRDEYLKCVGEFQWEKNLRKNKVKKYDLEIKSFAPSTELPEVVLTLKNFLYRDEVVYYNSSLRDLTIFLGSQSDFDKKPGAQQKYCGILNFAVLNKRQLHLLIVSLCKMRTQTPENVSSEYTIENYNDKIYQVDHFEADDILRLADKCKYEELSNYVYSKDKKEEPKKEAKEMNDANTAQNTQAKPNMSAKDNLKLAEKIINVMEQEGIQVEANSLPSILHMITTVKNYSTFGSPFVPYPQFQAPHIHGSHLGSKHGFPGAGPQPQSPESIFNP